MTDCQLHPSKNCWVAKRKIDAKARKKQKQNIAIGYVNTVDIC